MNPRGPGGPNRFGPGPPRTVSSSRGQSNMRQTTWTQDYRPRSSDRMPNNNQRSSSDYASTSEHGMRGGDQGQHHNNQHRDNSSHDYSSHRILDHPGSRDFGGGGGGGFREHPSVREHVQNSRADVTRGRDFFPGGGGGDHLPRNGGSQQMMPVPDLSGPPPTRLEQHHLSGGGGGIPSAPGGGMAPQRDQQYYLAGGVSIHEPPPTLDMHSQQHIQQHNQHLVQPQRPQFNAPVVMNPGFAPPSVNMGMPGMRTVVSANGTMIQFMPPLPLPARGQHTLHLNPPADRPSYRGDANYGASSGLMPPPPIPRGPPPPQMVRNHDQLPPPPPPAPSSSLQRLPEDVSFAAQQLPVVSMSRDVTPPTYTPPPPLVPYVESDLVRFVRENFESATSRQNGGECYYYIDKGDTQYQPIDPNFKPVDLEELRAQGFTKRAP